MVEAGIPCVGLGCLGGDLSQNDRHDEWIDVADFLGYDTETAEGSVAAIIVDGAQVDTLTNGSGWVVLPPAAGDAFHGFITLFTERRFDPIYQR